MSKKDPIIDLLIHDLTSPLSVVLTSVTNLLNKESTYGPITERQREALQRILRNSQKAQALLHDMIEAYRCEEGLFKKDSVSIEKILRESLYEAIESIESTALEGFSQSPSQEGFQQMLEDYNITVEITGIYRVSPFIHDEKKVQQILRNLVTNALKYRRSRMKISISGDSKLIIAVEDDGPGIPKEKRHDIFKRFINIEKDRSLTIQGFGFGLSCVKDLVESMGGEITVNIREGIGTCFTVCIPPLNQI